MMQMATHTGIIILAAGKASRMGKAKQLLPYADSTLLQHTLDVCTKANVDFVQLVVGAYAAEILPQLQSDALVCTNPDWESGMASSIRCGMQAALAKYTETSTLIFVVADQPYLNTTCIQQLINTHQQSQQPIVYSRYSKGFGTPVLFAKTFFPQLLQLTGDKGAKQLILQNENSAAYIHFPEGHIDIDTEADYRKLKEGA